MEKVKFEKGFVAFWPKLNHFLNTLIYTLVRIVRDGVTRALQQIF